MRSSNFLIFFDFNALTKFHFQDNNKINRLAESTRYNFLSTKLSPKFKQVSSRDISPIISRKTQRPNSFPLIFLDHNPARCCTRSPCKNRPQVFFQAATLLVGRTGETGAGINEDKSPRVPADRGATRERGGHYFLVPDGNSIEA